MSAFDLPFQSDRRFVANPPDRFSRRRCRRWSRNTRGKGIRRGPSPLNLEELEGRCLLSAGTLDGHFGTAGFRAIDAGGTDDSAAAMAFQSDGKIVLAGWTRNPGNANPTGLLLTRINADGSRDPSFGNNGIVQTDVLGSGGEATSMVVQSDDRIVVAGSVTVNGNTNFVLARYLPDGALDSSFGNNGIGTFDVARDKDVLLDVGLEPDGSIVAAGFSQIQGNSYPILLGLQPDGQLDPDFGTSGVVLTDYSSLGRNNARVNGMEILSDGSIITAGSAWSSITPTDQAFAIARYFPDGSLDTRFHGGKFVTDFGPGIDLATDVAVMPDGRVVIAGTAQFPQGFQLALARFMPDGSFDPTLGFNGQAAVALGTMSGAAEEVTVQPDGKLLVAATGSNGTNLDFIVARLQVNGALDARFGTNGTGVQVFDFGFGDDQAATVRLDRNNNILVGGVAKILSDDDIVVARFLNDVADRYEPNNSQSTASHLGTLSGRSRYEHLNIGSSNDEDWFQIILPSGARTGHSVSIDFNHDLGDLDLSLYDVNGTRVGHSAGVDSHEEISLGGLAGGVYYVRVYGFLGETNPDYTLTIDAPTGLVPDAFEPNDDPANPTALGTLTGTQQWDNLSVATASDRDFYRFDLSAGASSEHFVRLDFDANLGDIDMVLFNDSGQVVGQSLGVTGREQISLDGLASGSYILAVFGNRDATNPKYKMTIQAPGADASGDGNEPNNSRRDATELGTIRGVKLLADADNPLSINVPGDHDWFRFELSTQAASGHFVALVFDSSKGDLDLDLYDANDTRIASSHGSSNLELLNLDGLGPGAYYIDVHGANSQVVNPLYLLAFRAPGGDRLEPNNTRAKATDLRFDGGVHQETDLSIAPEDDEDWFRFETHAMSTVTNFVSIAFSHAQGDLDLELYDDSGSSQPLRFSRGVDDTERIALTNLPPGTYYLRVFGYDHATNPGYSLTLNTPELAQDNDPAEPNDTRSAAFDLGTVSGSVVRNDPDHPLSIHAGNDEDWFRFETVAKGQLGDAATIAFRNVDGDLDLELYDENGNLLDTSGGIGDLQSISLADRPAGIYYLRVIGYRESPGAPRGRTHVTRWRFRPPSCRSRTCSSRITRSPRPPICT